MNDTNNHSKIKTTEKAKQVLDDLVTRLQSGQVNFTGDVTKTFIDAKKFNKPSSSWSFGNLILMCYFGNTLDARTYRQWEKAGRYVKKGSKSFCILAPNTIKIKEKNDQGIESERTIITGFRGLPVFRIEDTEGDSVNYEPKELPPLYELTKHIGIKVEYESSVYGEYGSINPKTGEMKLSTESVDTFFHELVHYYDNKHKELKPKQDTIQEIVAQVGACVLSKMYGYDHEDYTWSYISHYAKTQDTRELGQFVIRLMGRIQNIIDDILKDAVKYNIV